MPTTRNILKNVVNKDMKGVTVVKTTTLKGDKGEILEKAISKDKDTNKGADENQQPITDKNVRPIAEQESKLTEVMEVVAVESDEEMEDTPILDVDEGDAENPQLMSSHVCAIYKYMNDLEIKCPVRSNFMSSQQEVTSRMRSILINWIVQVHGRFHLLQETLFLTINIIDRYLQEEQVPKTKFQLLGITSLWLASKLEEIYIASMEDHLFVTDNVYTKKDMEQMELSIVTKLDFSLTPPLSIHFLRRYSKAAKVNVQMHNMSKFILESTLLNYELASVRPSLLAAAALYVSRQSYRELDWDRNLTYHTGYSKSDILPTSKQLAILITAPHNSKLSAVYNKYSSSRFFNISKSEMLMTPQLLAIAERK